MLLPCRMLLSVPVLVREGGSSRMDAATLPHALSVPVLVREGGSGRMQASWQVLWNEWRVDSCAWSCCR